MATFTTYDQVGKAEDVSDVITNITPTDTPFTSSIRTEKVNARIFEFQEDSLAAAADNKLVEGGALSAGTQTPTTMLTNTTQILSKVFAVSKTADSTKLYGRAKETAYQLAKVLAEIKRDLEFAYIGHDNASVTGNSSTAREMNSFTQYINSDVTQETDSDAGTGGAQAGPITEANLLALGQKCYNHGANPTLLMIKPADAQTVANFAASSGRERDFGTGKTVVNVVDIYVSPYGTYKTVLNRHQITSRAFLIDPTYVRSCVLRPFARTLLAQTSDADTHAVVGEYSLKVMNGRSQGQITNLT